MFISSGHAVVKVLWWFLRLLKLAKLATRVAIMTT